MRALAVLALAFVLAPVLVSPAAGHAPAYCEQYVLFPSVALWTMQPGRIRSYDLPEGYIIHAYAAGPLDVEMSPRATCEVDPACDVHRAIGHVQCTSVVRSTVEISNRGAEPAAVLLLIEKCDLVSACV